MKTTELMIGDWVMVKHAHREPSKERVYAVGVNYVLTKSETTVGFSRISPIPLTPEILEKNGFTDCESDFSRNLYHYYLGEECVITNLDLHIGSDGENYWINTSTVSVRPLLYVHELQHALRLNRYKELANNFKI